MAQSWRCRQYSATSLGRVSFGSSSFAAHAFPVPFSPTCFHIGLSLCLPGFSLWPLGWGFPTSPPFLCVYIIERCGEFSALAAPPCQPRFCAFPVVRSTRFSSTADGVHGGWSLVHLTTQWGWVLQKMEVPAEKMGETAAENAENLS